MEGGIKPILILRQDCVYVENPTGSTKKLPELMSKFSKIAGYKINISPKSTVFLYTSKKQSETEILKISFIIASKIIIRRDKYEKGCARLVY